MTNPNAEKKLDVASAMLALFPASQRSHAYYTPDPFPNVENGKLKVGYHNVSRAATAEDWQKHLNGTRALVVPLACDNGTTQVICVEVDDNSIDVAQAVSAIKKYKLALYVHSSKSGGVHILGFFDAPVSVEVAREVGRGIARRLGLSDKDKPGEVEIFPKPMSANPEAFVKGLNMPYLGDKYWIIEPGSKICGQMTVERFLTTVKRLTAEHMEKLTKAKRKIVTKDTDDIEGAAYAQSKLKQYVEEISGLISGGNVELYKRAAHMGNMVAREWIEREEVEKALTEAIAGWDDQKRHLDTIKSALDQGARSPHANLDGRLVILYKPGTLSETTTKTEDALIRADMEFYQRALSLVRPVISETKGFHGCKTSTVELVEIDEVYMRECMDIVVSYHKLDGRDNKSIKIHPPYDIAKTLLARKKWNFPTVAGVITTPTMRPDGSILEKPGFDEQTQLLLVDPPPMPPIKELPTQEDALAALALFEGLLEEYPLVNDVSKAVALSCFITPVVRGAFPTSPMHAVDAPVAGSGKSYLLDTVSSIVAGRPMPVFAAGRNEEETEKRLGAAVLAAQPLITLDNVNGELGGDALCQLITQSRPQIRVLGRSEMRGVEVLSTVFANGNNLIIVGDLVRRTIRARMDPKMEQPELREFKGDPVATVLANRGAYVAAALTICRAYVMANKPGRVRRLASFEGWSDNVRSALMWLGCADPVDSQISAREEDPERMRLWNLLTAWSDVFGVGYPTRMTLRSVIEAANSTNEKIHPPQPKWPELFAAIRVLIDPRQPLTAEGLSYWLRLRKDRVVNGIKIGQKADRSHGSHWWVETVDGANKWGKYFDNAGKMSHEPEEEQDSLL